MPEATCLRGTRIPGVLRSPARLRQVVSEAGCPRRFAEIGQARALLLQVAMFIWLRRMNDRDEMQ